MGLFLRQHWEGRSRLCGAIVAAAAEREFSLAADNAGVAKGVNIYAIRRNRYFPYYRRPNSYLWGALWTILQRHADGAVKARWRKAHATQLHIQQGTTTEWEAKQNARADAAADAGRLAHEPEIRALAPHYRKVLEEYQHLVAKLKFVGSQ